MLRARQAPAPGSCARPSASSRLIEAGLRHPEPRTAARGTLGAPARHVAGPAFDAHLGARRPASSPATMTRLAQRLGFDGFEALRAALRAPAGRRRRHCGHRAAGPRKGRRALPRRSSDTERGPAGACRRRGAGQRAAGRWSAAADAMLSAPVRVLPRACACRTAWPSRCTMRTRCWRPTAILLTHLGGTLTRPDARRSREGCLLVAISQSPYCAHDGRGRADGAPPGRPGAGADRQPRCRRWRAKPRTCCCSTAPPTPFPLHHRRAGADRDPADCRSRSVAATACVTTWRMRQQRLQTERAYWERSGRQGSPVSGTARRRLPPSTCLMTHVLHRQLKTTPARCRPAARRDASPTPKGATTSTPPAAPRCPASGHGHPDVLAAMHAQVDRLAYAHTSFFTTEVGRGAGRPAGRSTRRRA